MSLFPMIIYFVKISLVNFFWEQKKKFEIKTKIEIVKN